MSIKRALPFILAIGLWLVPQPEGLSVEAWHLFAIFAAAIFAVIIDALPIFLASILALAAAVLTGTLAPDVAYSGFSEGFVLLILIAFLAGRAVVKSGLGARIAYSLVRRFGRSTLGMGYAMVATDAVIAPAFPSNTARSGVLYPIVLALAESNGSKPEDGSERKLGAFLMLNSLVGLSLSSALWLTAMAANPIGAAMVGERGYEITFGSWLLAASVPCLVGLVVIPWLLYRAFPPEVTSTPDAPQAAAARLREMGPMRRDEWVTAATFGGMVLGWSLSGPLGLDQAAVAFLGLGVLMLTGVFTLTDLRESGDALETLIWFAALYSLSAALDQTGFMSFVGERIGARVEHLAWPATYVIVVTLYVLIHYLFVSQTAHLLALLPVMLGVAADVPLPLIGFMLLFATNFFSAITPQGSSANVLFAGSGYLTARDIYKYGGLMTAANLVVFLAVGTPWLLMVT